MEIHELIARQEITDVIKRLARGTDRLDLGMMESCYHPDGFDDHNAFRGSGTEFAAWVCETLTTLEATHHFVADPYIRLAEDTAQVDTYCVAHHIGQDSDLVIGLRYVDRFERRSGRWLIARRVCAFVWHYVIPYDPARGFQFGPDFIVGHRDRSDISYTGV